MKEKPGSDWYFTMDKGKRDGCMDAGLTLFRCVFKVHFEVVVF